MSSTRNSSRSDGGVSWCTIESDPGVFTELISQIGVKDVQVEETYDLDMLLQDFNAVYGLVFLFKWRGDKDDRPVTEHPKLFFANQVINNACATQAILSILLNNKDLEIGQELTSFRDFVQDFNPELKGMAIGNCELVRNAHNSFARPEPFVLGTEKATSEDEAEDVYHFISYVPFDGGVYELDGLKKGPIFLGSIADKENWLRVAIPVIQQRIEKYAKSEIRFNLMSIVRDKRVDLKKAIEQQQSQLTQIDAKLSGNKELKEKKERVEADIESNKQRLQAEEEKFENWKTENIRRKHNYIPFIVNLLKILADRGELSNLISTAQKTR
ncbi:ubiquitin carboxyl-terminal hydrolase isozyme L5-like [Planoprotostelium fungivorum]|uniref:Ubiquitin carboxyl-terminal hydrolase n=1 Tax=Planoprotostelium fungivorum TaxID=1890364 RepID=A0A2P6NP62_9EUKA|nr:ubiquitin carboxyl-terminal hydrolase isozyme L5-like [Planoprotostelium fungivorum]